MTTQSMAKRRHDVQGALRTLTMATEALADGYKFDDESGPAKIAAMAKAVQVLERELPTFLNGLKDQESKN